MSKPSLAPTDDAAAAPIILPSSSNARRRRVAEKVSDEYTVPVCRLHQRELHAYGDEASWWAAVSIDPLPIALELWRRSRSDESA
jgi:hypothetical protein